MDRGGVERKFTINYLLKYVPTITVNRFFRFLGLHCENFIGEPFHEKMEPDNNRFLFVDFSCPHIVS